MKKNQSNNKFKLVKWKNKLVPTLFGTIGSLVPIVSMSSQGSGSGESAQEQIPPVLPEKEVVVTTNLVAGSFEFIGAEDKGTVRIKNSLPLEVEVKYVKKEDNSQPSEGDYQSVVPSDLSNGDKVYIKFYIKSGHSGTHKLPSSETGSFVNPFNLTVTGLKTQAQLDPALTAINGLDKNDFISIYDATAKNKLASDATNKDDKKAAIVNMIRGKISDNALKNQVIEDFISFDSATEGTLKIKINLVPLGGTDKKVIDITGFKTQAQLNTVLNAINSLDETAFNGIYDFAAKNKLASDTTNKDDKKADIVTMIKGKISNLVAKTLIIEDLIDFDTSTPGTLKIEIDTLGLKKDATLTKKVISIPGFPKNQQEIDDKSIALTKVKELVSNDFNIIYNFAAKNKLASNTENINKDKKNMIVDMIKSRITTSVTAKALIKDTLITFDGTTTEGILIIKINLEPLGEKKEKIISISGFETQQKIDDKSIALKKVKDLVSDDFNNIYNVANKNKISSHIENTNDDKKIEIVDMIKSKITSVTAKALIKDTLITLDGSTINGTLKIKINLVPLGGTSEKVISILGFPKNQKEISDKSKALTKVKELVSGDFNNIYDNDDKKKLASDNSNKDEKKDAIVTMIKSKITSVTAQALIKDTLITFDVNTSGTLIIKINLAPLGEESEKFISITGFTTQAQLKQAANRDINEIKDLFDDLKNAKSGTKTKLDSAATTLPSTLKEKTTSQTIGFDNPLKKDGVNNLKEVKATFSIKSIDDANGKLVVQVNLSKKWGDDQKVEFTLTGYQKASPPKTSGLSKGVIAGITIGVFALTFGIAFIVFRFLKLKKIKITK